MSAHTSETTSVPTWLHEQQQKTLAELSSEKICHAEAQRRLQLAAEIARRFVLNSNVRKVRGLTP